MNNTVTTGPRWHRRTWTIGALLLTALMLLIAACGDDNNGAAEDISATAECDAEPVILTTDDGVEFVRTPDSCFDDLPNFPHKPQYVEIDGLRQAYVDEGPDDGEVVLLLHGQPSWSYLYRKMIPVLAEAGCALVGGHSIDDAEPKYGLAVTGVVHPEEVMTKAGALPGGVLVVSGGLATGRRAGRGRRRRLHRAFDNGEWSGPGLSTQHPALRGPGGPVEFRGCLTR